MGCDFLKILFVSDNFPPESNAPATRLFEHAIRWVERGDQVTVITCAPNFPEGRLYPGYKNRWRSVEVVAGIRVVRVKTYIAANEGVVRRTLDYLSFMVTSVVAALFENRPDVVVATSPQFFCAVAGWAIAFFRRLPFVFELRDLWPASIAAVGAVRQSVALRCLERVELFLYRRAAAIVSVTESFRRDLVSRGISGDKIFVVVNGVDLSTYSARPKDPQLLRELRLEGKFVVGYLGTHGLAHGLPKVLEAVEMLLPNSEIAFVFAGGGAERGRVERTVAERRLSNVRLVSRQPKEVMPSLWSICDLTLIPLRNANLFSSVIPSKLFESMGMGIPVLMSIPEGEATAIVREAGCGDCVAPDDPKSLADAIERLARSPNTMAEFRDHAMAASGDYSREGQAVKMSHALMWAVERPRSP